MFEDYTYERLLEDVLNNAPEGIDTRQGSIFYDAVSGVLIKVAKLYTDLDLVVELSRLTTTSAGSDAGQIPRRVRGRYPGAGRTLLLRRGLLRTPAGGGDGPPLF